MCKNTDPGLAFYTTLKLLSVCVATLKLRCTVGYGCITRTNCNDD